MLMLQWLCKDSGDSLKGDSQILLHIQNTIGGWQQASNVLRIEPETRWMCLQPELWEHCDITLVEADMKKEDGTEHQYGDRYSVVCRIVQCK